MVGPPGQTVGTWLGGVTEPVFVDPVFVPPVKLFVIITTLFAVAVFPEVSV